MFNKRFLPNPQNNSSNLSIAKLRLATNQSIPNNTATLFKPDTIDFIDNTKFTYVPATGLFTFLELGVYQVYIGILWSSNVNGARIVDSFITDGGNKVAMGFGVPSQQPYSAVAQTVFIENVNATLQSVVIQTSGAALNVLADESSVINVVKLGNY